ncbi:PRC-barrel domain-containing protein [Bremerella cremea]|nr:PRC-barrel domain-containing protein [Bremerella cremea]
MLRKIPAVAAAALMAAGCVTSLAHADDVANPNQSNVQVDVGGPAAPGQADVEVNTADQATKAMFGRRASQIEGMAIHNEAGKDLGVVRDVVIDTDRGQVKYVAVSYGGFLGLGTKLFAVPFEAFQYHPATQGHDARLVLNLNEEILRKAPGFDADNWPDMASQTFTNDIDKHYRHREGGLNIQAGPVGIQIGGKRKAAADQPTNPLAVHRAANIIGMNVVNNENDKVGTINDLMIDMSNGHVRYAALSVGGLAGIGDSMYAVAWDQFRWKHNAQNDTNELVLNVDPKLLKDVKGFDQDNWPQHATARLGTTKVDANVERPGVDADINVPGVRVDVDTKDN